ncbi:MAG: MFS transporter [Chloroflexi bacterium]|nr:MFS transporter [Chloroflexota bacterium]
MSPMSPPSAKEGGIWGLSPNVFFLGIVSLLTDISSEMIFTLVPLFLANVIKAPFAIIGLIGGLSDSVDAVFRIFSGWFSDRIGKYKAITVWGYSVSTVVKPLMYIALNWGAVLAIRFGDRVGKGLRSSSRDALLSHSIDKSQRGKGFGIHRAMDTLGAVIGLTLAAVIIYSVQGGGLSLGLKTYQWLVLMGTIPAVVAVIVLAIAVHERKRPAGEVVKQAVRLKWSDGFDARFKIFLAIVGLFSLGKSSDFFVILRAQNLAVPLIEEVLMLVFFNIIYAIVALPAGVLSDKIGRRRVMVLGWTIYVLIYLGFALAVNNIQVWLLFAGYGIYNGMVEGVGRAFVADLVVPEKRGTAYGLYHGVVSLTLLPASLIAGWLWQAVAPAAPFFYGAALAFLAILGMLIFIREPKA